MSETVPAFPAFRPDEAAGQAEARVRHKKRGTEYAVLGVGKMQAENWRDHENNTTDGIDIFPSEVDMREVTIYRGDDGQLWVRPVEEFNDGRFEPVATPRPEASDAPDIVERLTLNAVVIAPLGSASGKERWISAESMREAADTIAALRAELAAMTRENAKLDRLLDSKAMTDYVLENEVEKREVAEAEVARLKARVGELEEWRNWAQD